MRSLITFFLTTCLLSVLGQDPHFSTLYNSALYENPALAATDSMDYAQLKYRNQWPRITGNYVTTNASYIHYSPKLNGAAYLSYTRDVAGSGTLTTQNVSLGYAQKLKLGEELLMQLGAEFRYFNKVLDWSKLTFGDMVDPRRGFVYETNDVPRGGMVSGIDLAAGVAFKFKKAFAGVSGYHLTEPDESVILGTSPLPVRLGIQAGYDFQIREELVLRPVALYMRQSNFKQLNLSCFAVLREFVFGLGTRLDDAYLITLGYGGSRILAYYTFDATISNLSMGTGGAHEVSLAYRLWKKVPHKNYLEF